MSTRLKFAVVSVLLCLSLICMIFAAVSTAQAYQQFEQQHQHIMAGDVDTISFWMTIPYIARVYHAPEACLSQNLQLATPFLQKRASLRLIADHFKEPVEVVIRQVQQIILRYRQHGVCLVARAIFRSEGGPYD